MSAANVAADGKAKQLDRPAQPSETVTVEDVQDPRRLAERLTRMLRREADLERRWDPRRIDHEKRVVDATGTTKHRFVHRFGGRVRWWPVAWSGVAGYQFSEHADTDANTLVLVSFVAGTVTLRLEEAG